MRAIDLEVGVHDGGIHSFAAVRGTLASACNSKAVILIKDRNGVTVGYLSKNFRPPARLRCSAARVHAICVRYRRDSAPEYAERLRSERWEVVVPELVLRPIGPLEHALGDAQSKPP